jgi:HK97 family phage major capsid protein
MNLRAKAIAIAHEAQKSVKQCEAGEISVAELTAKMARLEREHKEVTELQEYGSHIPAALRGGAGAGSGRNENGNPDGRFVATPPGMRIKGAQAVPLGFDENELRAMHEAVSHRQSYALKTKAFSSVEPYLPAQLQPTVVGPQYEHRLLDRLPVQVIEAPSLEYLVHQSTTGTPAIVAEGAVKPELIFVTEPETATPQKIAAHTALSWETISDWSNFTQYALGEIVRQVVNVENAELIAGPGTAGHLHGFLGTSGILTHAVANGTTNTLDDVEQSIATLRSGPALAEADLLVLHPNTWSAMRRTKDSYGRYLVTPDPTSDEANSLWGVEVLPTTQITAGDGLLLDTKKFGFVAVREAVSLRTGTNDDDFTRNLQRWVAEERLELAVERPSAVLSISGLPTS